MFTDEIIGLGFVSKSSKEWDEEQMQQDWPLVAVGLRYVEFTPLISIYLRILMTRSFAKPSV